MWLASSGRFALRGNFAPHKSEAEHAQEEPAFRERAEKEIDKKLFQQGRCRAGELERGPPPGAHRRKKEPEQGCVPQVERTGPGRTPALQRVPRGERVPPENREAAQDRCHGRGCAEEGHAPVARREEEGVRGEPGKERAPPDQAPPAGARSRAGALA